MRWLITLLVVALGATVFVLGGMDDSPGLQGVGAIAAAGAAILYVRAAHRDRHRP